MKTSASGPSAESAVFISAFYVLHKNPTQPVIIRGRFSDGDCTEIPYHSRCERTVVRNCAADRPDAVNCTEIPYGFPPIALRAR
eukprot:COSAG02_NODE_65_length_42645_cov_26.951934_3_plen_84_part_00